MRHFHFDETAYVAKEISIVRFSLHIEHARNLVHLAMMRPSEMYYFIMFKLNNAGGHKVTKWLKYLCHLSYEYVTFFCYALCAT